MEPFAWWLLESLAASVVQRAVKRLAPNVLGWMLGSGYRSLRDDFRTLEENPGRGDTAARLIARAPNFSRAERVFFKCRASPRIIDENLLYKAMIARLQREGPTPMTLGFLAEREIAGIPEDSELDANTDEEREYERQRHYERMLVKFEELSKKDHSREGSHR